MAKKKPSGSKKSKDEDEEFDEPFAGTLKKDLMDQVKWGKRAAARKKRLGEKLAKLAGIDPKAEAEQRTKEYQHCLAAAEKRMQQLHTEHARLVRKRVPIMQQVQNMISREPS